MRIPSAFAATILLAISHAVAADPSDRRFVAVAPLTSGAIPRGQADLIGDALSSSLQNRSGWRMMERSQIDKILQEQGFQNSGACDKSECAIQMGKVLGIDRIVVGSVGKLGESYMLNARLVDVATGEIVASSSQTGATKIEAVATDLVPRASTELLGEKESATSPLQQESADDDTSTHVGSFAVYAPRVVPHDRWIRMMIDLYGGDSGPYECIGRGVYGIGMGLSYPAMDRLGVEMWIPMTMRYLAPPAYPITPSRTTISVESPEGLLLTWGIEFRATWKFSESFTTDAGIGYATPLVAQSFGDQPASGYFYMKPALHFTLFRQLAFGIFTEYALEDALPSSSLSETPHRIHAIGISMQSKFSLRPVM